MLSLLATDIPSSVELLMDAFWPGPLTLALPKHPQVPSNVTAGLDQRVTITGSGFGTFLKGAEHAPLAINQKAYKRREDVGINDEQVQGTLLSNVACTEVLFNGTAALVESWTDSKIVVRVPHRNL